MENVINKKTYVEGRERLWICYNQYWIQSNNNTQWL